ncbi:hypothetical protein JCM11672_02790 [Alkaliphilus crotonatoxidans]
MRIVGADAYNNDYYEKICVELNDEEDLSKYMNSLESTSVTEMMEKSSYGHSDYIIC